MKDIFFLSSSRSVMVSLIVVTALLLSGCPPKRTPPPSDIDQSKIGYVYHKVQYPGETLSIIANWYTGNPRNWELVVDANPGLDPRRMRIGDVINIPREFIVREDPMPKSALGSRAASPKPSVQAPQTTSQSESNVPVTENTLVEDQNESLGNDSSAATEAASSEEEAFDQSEVVASQSSESSVSEESVEASASSVGAEVSESAASVEAAPDERPEQRIKTRDELLKELLEE